MKICKCSKCGESFNVSDNFMGTILCEDCDPFMQDVRGDAGKYQDKISAIETALQAVLVNSNNYGMHESKWQIVKDKISDAFNALDYLKAVLVLSQK